MAGLLDFFGNGWDDPKSNAVMALAGGLLDGDFAGGMKGYSGVMAGAGEAKMKRLMQEAQIAKYAADTDMDKQKLTLSQGKEKRDSDLDTIILDAMRRRQSGGAPASPNMPVTGSQDGMQGGMPSGGQSFGGDPFAGIDSMALLLDQRNNGGKNMGGWVNDRTKPDMAVTDGYAWDKNRTSAGFMPFLRTDASGKTSMGQIGGNGLPVVSAPQGALETFNAYRNADESVKNKNTLSTVTLPGGGTSMVTNEALLDAARGGQPQARPTPAPMGQPQANKTPWISNEAQSDRMGMYESELNKWTQALANPNLPPQERARITADIQGVQREMRNAGGRPPSLAPNQSPPSAPGFGLPLQSLSEKERTSAENDAYKATLVDTAKANVVRDSSKATESKQHNQFSTGINRAIDLLNQNPTSSGIGALADAGLGFVGQSTKSGDVANQLTALSGWLTANVPRMEGPQSNFDVDNYKVMAGAVGDKTKPISTRLAAANEVKRLQDKYASINGKEAPKQDAKSASVPAQPMRGAIISGYRFKGGDPANQANWEKQ